jgi:hypothetical protein
MGYIRKIRVACQAAIAAIRQARSYSWNVTDPESGRLVSRLREGAGTAKSPEAAYRPAWFDANAKPQPPSCRSCRVKRGCDLLDVKHPQNSRQVSGRHREQARSHS